MPLSGSANWAVVLPSEKLNEILNPSLELGTTGWGTYTAGTIGTTSAFQQFGAWSGSYAPTSNGTAGAMSGSWTAGNGTAYTASIYARLANGIPYIVAVSDVNGQNIGVLGTIECTGGGTWQRYSVRYTENFGGDRRILVRKNSSADTSAFYVDGAQVEKGSLTTYFDGDTKDCTWLGAPHASQSYRASQVRSGGSVVALQDLGMLVDDALGVGMPPLETSIQSYAVLDGANFTRSRTMERPFSLPVTMIGNSLQGIHAVRRAVINAFKIDAVTPQQPTRFWYTGAGGTVQIDAVLDAGLEMGKLEGFTEKTGVRFIATDPYWYTTTQQGTSLSARVNLGSVLFAAYRDPLGRWGTMGPSGSALNAFVNTVMPASSGLIYYGGGFGSAGGTRTRFIAAWNPVTGAWGSLPGGTVNNSVWALAETASGTVLVGGEFSAANGTTANGIALYSPAGSWGTTNGGGLSASGIVRAIDFAGDGNFYTGGQFTTAAGTSAGSVAFYNAATDRWGTMRTGVVAGTVNTIQAGLDTKVYVGGYITSVDGTSTAGIGAWDTNTQLWGTMGLGIQAGGAAGLAGPFTLAVTPNGLLYAGGNFGSAGGGTAQSFAVWNGVQWFGFGSGANYLAAYGNVYALLARNNGNVFIAGDFVKIGDLKVPSPVAGLMNTTFTPLDIDAAPARLRINAFAQANDGTVYIGNNLAVGSVYAASVAQVVNSGLAQVHPIIKMRNTSTGTVPIYQIVNTLTNDGIYFNGLSLQPNEEVTLNLTPGNRSVTSSFRGNALGYIIPGSQFAHFRLLSGTNYISFFAGNDSVVTSMYWTPRSWSADQGTI